jgi:hypothetical protein
MIPFRLRRFQVTRASEPESTWLADTLDRESRPFGVRVERAFGETLMAHPCYMRHRRSTL